MEAVIEAQLISAILKSVEERGLTHARLADTALQTPLIDIVWITRRHRVRPTLESR